jgi:hypothetical protein
VSAVAQDKKPEEKKAMKADKKAKAKAKPAKKMEEKK